MSYEGNFQGDQTQTPGVCHNRGISHDQVFSDRTNVQSTKRCNDNTVVVNGDIYLGDAPAAPQPRQVIREERTERYDRYDRTDRYADNASRYGDDYTGSNSRMAQLREQDFYRRQEAQREQQLREQQMFGGQNYAYEGYPPPQRYGVGINPQQLLGAGLGAVLGGVIGGAGHHGWQRREDSRFGMLAGGLLGGALTGGNNGYDTGYMGPPPVVIGQGGWNSPPPYHYRHESPQQRYWEMQQQRQRQAYAYNYSNPSDSNGYDTW